MPPETATAAEHCAEDVARIAPTAALAKTFLTMCVISATLFVIRQDFKGGADLLEGLLVTTAVGMVLEC